MGGEKEDLSEWIKGLDGLVMLCEWELALAKDLRERAVSLLEERGERPLENGRVGRPGD
jgi:hypothetical protein